MSEVVPSPESLDDLALARLRGGLRAFVRGKVRDATAVDDIVQDIFVKLASSHQQGRAIGNINGWLHAVARHAIADHFRARHIDTEPFDVDELPSGSDVHADDTRAHQALAGCIAPMVSNLPAPYRDTLAAVDLGNETLASLAAREGLSLSAIKSRAARGRGMLRKKLLACCAVEIQQGLVTDYRQKAGTACAAACGTPSAPASGRPCGTG